MAAQRLYGRFMGAALAGGPLLVAGSSGPAQRRPTRPPLSMTCTRPGSTPSMAVTRRCCRWARVYASNYLGALLPVSWRTWRCNAPTATRAPVGSPPTGRRHC